MRFLKSVQFDNYMNLEHVKLNDLRDLNIIIGPNNCGKTNVLRGIKILEKVNPSGINPLAICSHCANNIIFKVPHVMSTSIDIDVHEQYRGHSNVSLTFDFNIEDINKIALGYDKIIEEIKSSPQGAKGNLDNHIGYSRLELKSNNGMLHLYHASALITKIVEENLFKKTLFCPDARLEKYKGKTFSEFITGKDFSTRDQGVFIDFLKETIDPRIYDIKQSLTLMRSFGDGTYDTLIEDQGSGVKSLICIAAEIIAAQETKIMLIDEPELGLNPAAKQIFLKFLLNQTEKKQIFMSTHDPTFVNPVLWEKEKVAVFLFSHVANDFVKIDLNQSNSDPNTFAGYLPHTMSLKNIHIYVEGSTDVYILQIFLHKYLRENWSNWYVIANQVGIYHLAGDFLEHLLYTIPKKPYFSVVILDGDKAIRAPEIIRKNNVNGAVFQLANNPEDLRLFRHNVSRFSELFPVYCLKKSEIEDYLTPSPSSKQEGPKIADLMDEVPEEIAKIFDAIFSQDKQQGIK